MLEILLGNHSKRALETVQGSEGAPPMPMPVDPCLPACSGRRQNPEFGGHFRKVGQTDELDYGEEHDLQMKPLSQKAGSEVLLTYGQTVSAFFADSKTDAERGNRTAPLNKFMAFHKVTSDTMLVEISPDLFAFRLREYLETLKSGPNQTRYNHKRILIQWWDNHVKPYTYAKVGDGLPAEFGAAMGQALNNAGMTQYDLVKETGIPLAFIANYINGKRKPRRGSSALVETIEKALSIPITTLSSRCDNLSHDPSESEKVKNRRHACRKLTAEKYRFSYKDWPQNLKSEWLHFEEVATGKLVPYRGYKAGNFWNTDKDRHSATAKLVQQFFEAFFGFCKIMEIPTEHLTLALIKHYDLVILFFEFFRLRQGGTFIKDKETMMSPTAHLPGEYTATTTTWIGKIISFLKPATGYIWQIHTYAQATSSATGACDYLPRPNLASLDDIKTFNFSSDEDCVEVTLPKEVTAWRRGCLSTYEGLMDWLKGKQRRKEIRYTNIVEALVEPITSLDRPLDALIEAANKMEQKLPTEPDIMTLNEVEYAAAKQALAIQYQDMLIFRLNSAVPLRPKNNRKMSFRGEYPNLFQHDGQAAWILKFKEWEMKNFSERTLTLPRSVWPYIDKFLKDHRPWLVGPHTDYFFRPAESTQPTKRVNSLNLPMSAAYFSGRFVQATSKAFGGLGFTVYGLRHVCATAWLKEDPDGFLVAAVLLDDDIKTVMENYVHLRKDTLYRHYDGYHERAVERAATGTVACESVSTLSVKDIEIVVTNMENAMSRGQSLTDVVAAMKAVLRQAKLKA